MFYQVNFVIIFIICFSYIHSFLIKPTNLQKCFRPSKIFNEKSNSIISKKLELSYEMKTLDFLSEYEKENIFGVFMIYNNKGEIQYVSKSKKSVVEEVKLCLEKAGEEKVHSIRVQSFSVSDERAIDAYRTELLNQIGQTPPGNSDGPNGWFNKNELDANTPNLKSQVIDISEIESPKSIESPFIQPDTQIYSEPQLTHLELNKVNVDKVLNEVRPYLIADGGNVEVVSVDASSRNIVLRLQGACGSCPSSTTTMKMGIERVLRENFLNLGEIISAAPEEEASILTQEAVESALQKVLPAVKSLGGLVEISSVDSSSSTVNLKYTGPSKLIKGIEIIIKEIPKVKNVVIQHELI